MLEKKFIENVHRNQLFNKSDRLVVAASGGMDSTVLCRLLWKSGFNFEMAHVNFQLRGAESNDDEQFARQVAASYQARIHVLHADTNGYADAKKVSLQVAARQLRYAWFDELLESGYGYLLTAHHADDNIETVAMHFFRGTGIHGLTGIPTRMGRYVRPLLPFGRAQLLQYAKDENISWRDDSSNNRDKYTRNFFRLHIIPLVSKVYPEAEHNMLENIRRLSEASVLYDEAVQLRMKKLVERRGNEVHIPVLKLKKMSAARTLMFELTKPFGFAASQLDDLMHLLDGEHGKMVYSLSHRIIRNRDWLIIVPRENLLADHIVIEEGDNRVQYNNAALRITRKSNEAVIDRDRNVAMLNLQDLRFPLILRRWKAGDYFYPLGLNKKKKVARFLIDMKLSRTEKEDIWVLESDKRICWVVGMRIDDRFKITDTTKEVLYVKLERQT